MLLFALCMHYGRINSFYNVPFFHLMRDVLIILTKVIGTLEIMKQRISACYTSEHLIPISAMTMPGLYD